MPPYDHLAKDDSSSESDSMLMTNSLAFWKIMAMSAAISSLVASCSRVTAIDQIQLQKDKFGSRWRHVLPRHA